LRKIAAMGAELAAAELGRSERSVRVQASRHGISLRRTGERRGSVLGERAPGTLPPEERRAVLYGVADPARALARARLDVAGSLCPACGYRPAEVRSTGLCAVCHDRRLAEAHRQEAYAVEARRDLVTARQQKRRARIANAPEHR
jgi:hypothetical protein